MVDYRKWDKFVSELSDDDDISPQVTTIDSAAGAQVTIGPQGVSINSSPKILSVPSPAPSRESHWKNGSVLDTYMWSQTAAEVVVKIFLPSGCRAKSILLTLTPDNAIRITMAGSRPGDPPFFERTLRYPIVSNDASEDSCGVDWEVMDHPVEAGTAVVVLTLRKKSPIPGAVMWWSNVFVGDPEIDVSKIEGRTINTQTALAWAEAHKMFQERIRDKAQIAVDADDDEEA